MIHDFFQHGNMASEWLRGEIHHTNILLKTTEDDGKSINRKKISVKYFSKMPNLSVLIMGLPATGHNTNMTNKYNVKILVQGRFSFPHTILIGPDTSAKIDYGIKVYLVFYSSRNCDKLYLLKKQEILRTQLWQARLI